jgi:hypothetical protein
MPLFDQRAFRQGKRPLGVTIIATWFLLSGGLSILSGGIALTMLVASILPSLDSDSTGMGGIIAFVFGLIAILGLVLGPIFAVAGLGLLKMKRWGIWSCIAISALSGILSFYALLSLFSKIIFGFSSAWEAKQAFASVLQSGISIAIAIVVIKYLIAFQRNLASARVARDPR